MRTEKKIRLAIRRHMRVRKRVRGTGSRPRMSVAFTNQHIYVQFIDDEKGATIASVSTLRAREGSMRLAANKAGAEWIGRQAAEAAKTKGVQEVVFDRGSARYHWTAVGGKTKQTFYGKLATLAEAARGAGLVF